MIATHRSIGETLPVVLRRSFTWDQGPEVRDWKDAAMAAESNQLLRPAQALIWTAVVPQCRKGAAGTAAHLPEGLEGPPAARCRTTPAG